MNDEQLRSAIKDIKLESPSASFTVNVMNKIHESANLAKVPYKILGLNFWVFVSLFMAVAILFALFANGADTTGVVQGLLPSSGNEVVKGTYQSILNKLNMAPLSLAGILLGASFLLIIERVIAAKTQQAP